MYFIQDTSSLQVKKGCRTASFNGIINGNGDFLAGIADMEILDEISQDHLDAFLFGKSKILIIDSNISENTLSYILNNANEVKYIIYEPISQEKSTRILHSDLLSKINILKPNIL